MSWEVCLWRPVLKVVAACLSAVGLSGTDWPAILCLALCGVTAKVHELRCCIYCSE